MLLKSSEKKFKPDTETTKLNFKSNTMQYYHYPCCGRYNHLCTKPFSGELQRGGGGSGIPTGPPTLSAQTELTEWHTCAVHGLGMPCLNPCTLGSLWRHVVGLINLLSELIIIQHYTLYSFIIFL